MLYPLSSAAADVDGVRHSQLRQTASTPRHHGYVTLGGTESTLCRPTITNFLLRVLLMLLLPRLVVKVAHDPPVAE